MDHKQVSDTWERGNPYEQYVGRWSRQVAPLFLSWLAIPAGRGWLDVGCGTGALCAAIVDRCSPASVAGVEPSEGFLKTARENLADRAALHQGSATAIPLGDASVDVVVSGLVLNFVPDQRAALAEMARVTGKGGMIAGYVWDYAARVGPGQISSYGAKVARIRTHYLDASALVKLVIAEDHADKLRTYCGRALLATTSLCFGEALGVLKGKWDHGRLTHEAYLAACEDLFARVRNDSLEIEDTPLLSGDPQELRANYEKIEKLAQKYSLDISDALQLLTLRSGTYSRLEGTARASLVTADRKLARAAIAEGMPAWDCVHDPAP